MMSQEDRITFLGSLQIRSEHVTECMFTLLIRQNIQNAVLHLHVPAQIPLQVELAAAVGALEGLATSMKVHVAK